MGALTNHAEGLFIKAFFGTNRCTAAPATYYAALFTAAPGETGGGTECDYTNYARVAISNVDASWDFNPDSGTDANSDGVADDATIANAAEVAFPTAGAGDPDVATYWGLFDAATNGNLLIYDDLTTGVTIDPGDTPSFAIGALRYQQDT